MVSDEEEYLHLILDKINVPRLSKAGIPFRLFGRVLVLVEKLIEKKFTYE